MTINSELILKKFSLYSIIIFLLVMTGCGKTDTANSNNDAVNNKEVTNNETTYVANSSEDDYLLPIEYASIVNVSINPEFNIYLDYENVVIKVEAVNADAEDVLESLSLEGLIFEECYSQILVESAQKDYLVNGRTVEVTLTYVASDYDKMDPKDIIGNAKFIGEDITKTNDINAPITIFEDRYAVINVVTDEIGNHFIDNRTNDEHDNIDFNENDSESHEDRDNHNDNHNELADRTCSICGGQGTIVCDSCNGAGEEIEIRSHEEEVRNDYVCPKCGGKGWLDDGMHGGKTAECGNCTTNGGSGDFNALAYDKITVEEEVHELCPACNGQGRQNCYRCNGSGVE